MNAHYNDLSSQYAIKPNGYYGTTRSEMLSFVPVKVNSLLDIGCSSGGFGKLIKLRQPEIEVWGIEPDEASAHVAESYLDHVILGTFSPEHSDLRGKQFDVVCFNDVLEHLVNPEKALSDVKQLLSPNGVVVASIPNILFFYQIMKILVEQDWKYETSGIMDNTHLRFFTKKSILRLFESVGYSVSRIEGIHAAIGPKYRIANFLLAGRLYDWRFEQFAVVAQPVRQSE